MVFESATTPTQTPSGAQTPVNEPSASPQTTRSASSSRSVRRQRQSKKLIIHGRSPRSSRRQRSILQSKSSVSTRSVVSQYLPETATTDAVPSQSLLNEELIHITPEAAGGAAKQVEDEAFYHGFMSNDECKPLLTNPGDFLIRRAEVDSEMQYVITVLPENSNELANFIIKKTHTSHLYYVYTYAFETISDLIAYHSRTKKPLNNQNICIVKGIGRSDWEFTHEQIERNKKLGEGAFGEVWEGTLNLGVFRGSVPVAVKILHSGNVSTDERIKFLREANLMLKLSHPNVIKFYGVATLKDPIMIVMEFASGGSLLARVQNTKRPPNNTDKIRYCAGAASGLAYLETVQIIHRDVAARNCLLDADDEVKLSDFGLSLLGIEHCERSMKNVPIRWECH